MNQSHPGRSSDFLSRLHDGELDPGERAHFEAHRAHCAECRKAAGDFEAALSAFRTSATRPAPPDLSSRILRKLQAANRRGRSPLGTSFGIDLRWAGAFTAALVAVLLGYAVVGREPVRRIPVTLVTPASVPEKASAEPEAKSQGALPAPVRPPVRILAKPASAPPAESRRDAAKKEAPRETDSKEAADQPTDRLAEIRVASAGRAAADAERPMRVTVLAALDGQGAAPSLLDASQLTLTAAQRGQYVVNVDAQGAVRSVEGSQGLRENSVTRKDPSAPDLRNLRFAPGDRPRRLLLRID